MMNKLGLRRGVCLLLALLMVLALPAAALEAAGTTEATEDPTEAVTGSPFEDATEDDTEAPTEPASEPASEPATAPATEPAATEAPTQPATEPASEPATEPVTEPAAGNVTEPATEAPTEPAAESPTELRYVDEDGHYLAPEQLVVVRTMTMDQKPEEGEEIPAPTAENLFDRYTGVVAFYDYKAEAELEQEQDRFRHPFFFYYEDGVLQKQEERFVTAQGWLDLRAPAVAQGDVLAGTEQEFALREVYVGREVYVDAGAESHADYLFVFNRPDTVNGLFTGEREGILYADGLAKGPAEVKRAGVNPADMTLVPGKDSIKISWKATEGAESYTLSRSENKADWVKLAENLTALTYTDSAVSAGKRYYYTVQSKTGETLSELVDTRTDEANSVSLHQALTLTAVNGKGGVSLSWTGDSTATGYRVLRKAKGATSWTTLKNIADGKTLSWLDTSAANGTSYTYGVRAYYGPAGKIGSIPDTNVQHWGGIAQKSFTLLCFTTVYSAADGLVLKWKAVSGVSGYQINYRTTPNGKWAGAVDTGKKTVYTIKGAKNNAKYYLAIRTYVSGKGGKKTYSAWTIYTTPDIYHAVIKVKADAVPKGVQITWSKDSKATGWRIYRKSGGKTTVLANLPNKGKYSYIDPAANLTGGTKYAYTVRAYYGKEDIKTASTRTGDNWSAFKWVSLQYLEAPKVVNAGCVADGVKINWKTSTGAAGYRIYRKSGKKSWAPVGTVGKGSITSFVDTSVTKLPSGTTLQYTVRAFTSNNVLGSYDTTGVKALYLAKPENVKVKDPKASGTAISWDGVKGAEGYLVYRRDSSRTRWKKIGLVYGTTYVDNTLTKRGGYHAYTIKAVATLDGRQIGGCYQEEGYSYGILWKGSERSEWVKKDGQIFYVDETGYLMSGWNYIKRHGRTYKYYFDEKTGALVTNMYSYFGVKMREMPTFVEVWLDNNDDYASHVNVMLYDSETDSYCIPALTFRCIANLDSTRASRGHGTAYIPVSGYINRFGQLIEGEAFERYSTRVKGTNSFFHSLLYKGAGTFKLHAFTYNSMVRNVNNSVACIRCQCLYAYLIADLTENGYGSKHRIGVNIYRNEHDLGPYGIPKVSTISRGQSYDPTDPAYTGKFFYDTQIREGSHYITATAGANNWCWY